MAIIPLSQLMSVTSVGPTDLFILDQAGSTMKGTIAQIVANAKLSTTADIQLTNLQTGQVLVYNVSSGVWTNQNPVATFATLTDVDVSNAGPGKYLEYLSSESKYGFATVGYPFQIVQEGYNINYGSSSTNQVTFAAATTTGNTLMAVISWAKDSGAFTLASPWTQVMAQSETGSYSALSIYTKPAAGENSVTSSGPSNTNAMRVFEIKGSRSVDQLAFTYSNVNVYQNPLPSITPAVGAMVFTFAAFTSNGWPSALANSNYTEFRSTIGNNKQRHLGGGVLNGQGYSGFIPPNIYCPIFNSSTGPVLATISFV